MDSLSNNVISSSTKQSKPSLITVMHASVGSGHKAAAHAIAQAVDHLKNSGEISNDYEVEVLDVLDFGLIKFDGNKAASAFTGVTRPIYDLTWRYTLTGRFLWGGGTAWSRLMFSPFNDYVRNKKPVAVICTHITAANVAVGARMITGVDYPIISVPTDYEIEGWWPHKQTDVFCVATEFMAETLRARKVEEQAMDITGIPIRMGFGVEHDHAANRSMFNLPVDKTVVLVMAGASLPQPYVRFRSEIEQTIPYLRRFEHMHFVFLPGKDRSYAGHLRRIFEGMNLSNATVLDYVDDMAALMHTSDLAILKSGGLTVTECLCAELPMILLGRSYAQEKSNTTMLSSFGACMHATTARELTTQLSHLHDNPEVLHALLVNAAALRRPHAAEDVVRSTLQAIKQPRAHASHFAEFYWGKKPAHTR